MAAELRWILLGLSALLLAGIWWWGTRRSRQAPGNAELRESTRGPSPIPTHPVPADDPMPRRHSMRDEAALHEPSRHEAGTRESLPMEHLAKNSEPREWGVPPFEPLSIRTAEFDPVPIIDMPMTADAEPQDVTEPQIFTPMHSGPDSAAASAPDAVVFDAAGEGPRVQRSGDLAATLDGPLPENSGRFAAATPQAPNVSETQRIVSVRVCAEGGSWGGTELLAALEDHGLGYGRYKVFHRKHSDGRTLFCAASLVEPGTFDIAQMPAEEFRGLTLFAVLPGPAEPLATIDALLAAAAALAESLHGTVRDSQGIPLSAQRAEALREDVASFQALLSIP